MRVEKLGPLDGANYLVYSEILGNGETSDTVEHTRVVFKKLLQQEALHLMQLRQDVMWHTQVLNALTEGNAAEMQRLYNIQSNP